MSDYIIVKSESTYSDYQLKKEDRAITKFEAKVKKLLDEGYSLGHFEAENGRTNTITQVMYKTVLPQAPFVNNKLALSEGSKGGSRTLRRRRRH